MLWLALQAGLAFGSTDSPPLSSLAPTRSLPGETSSTHFRSLCPTLAWDFVEGVTIRDFSGGYKGSLEWVAKVLEHTLSVQKHPLPRSLQEVNFTAYQRGGSNRHGSTVL